MTKQKSTKRALLLSALSLLMCVSMLIGSTFAWFTDSVTSGNNIIKSGNLDIELEYWNGTDWADVKDASDILTNTLWEPGVTEVAYLRIANAGSLVLKYQFGVNILNEIEGKNQKNETFKLSDYIMFGVVEGVNGETAAYAKTDAGRTAAIAAVTDAKKISAGYTKASTMNPNEELYLALVVYMPTNTDNVANHNGTDVPQIDLGINVLATQMTAENDNFGNGYDEAAKYVISSDEKMIFNGTEFDTLVSNNGTVDMTNAKIENDNTGFENYGDATLNGVTVNAGTPGTQAYGYAINAYAGSTTVLNDVVVNSANGAIGVTNGANLTFNSGSVDVDSESTSGRYLFYVEGAGSTLTINGGNFDFNKTQNQKRAYIYAGEGTIVCVNGGNFGKASTRSGYSAGIMGSGTVVITGGTFKFDPTAWVADGCTATKNGDTWTVSGHVVTPTTIDDAIASGEKYLVLEAGNYGVINVTNANDNLTLVAAGEGVVVAGINGQSNNFVSTVTVKGITIDNSLQTDGWYTGTAQNIKPCVGVWGGNYVFEDCIFNVTGASKAETGIMTWWVTKVGTMTFNGCTFNGGNSSARAMQIYGSYNLNVNDCTFNTAKDYSIKYVGAEGLTATFKNNTVNNTENFVQTGSAPYAGANYALVFEGNVLADGIKHVYVDNAEGQSITVNGTPVTATAGTIY